MVKLSVVLMEPFTVRRDNLNRSVLPHSFNTGHSIIQSQIIIICDFINTQTDLTTFYYIRQSENRLLEGC